MRFQIKPTCLTHIGNIFGLAIVLAIIFAQVSLAQTESPHTQAISLYNLGLKAYREGSPESAIIFFRRATDIDPALADAQYNLGVVYMTQKRYRDAIPRFQQVLQIKPNDTDALYQLGIIMQESNHLDEAKNYFSSIPPNCNRFSDAQSHITAINNAQANGTTIAPQLLNTTSSVSATASSNIPYSSNTSVQGNTTAQPIVSTPQATLTPITSNMPFKVVATGFNAPSGLAFDKFGNLYVANYLTNTIDRIDTDGIRSRFSSAPCLKGPIGLIIDGVGNVYVANYNGGTISRISPAGIATTIASGFHKPYYLALDRGNNLYISQQEDNSVVRLSLSKSDTASR